jgi:hypothetical protein
MGGNGEGVPAPLKGQRRLGVVDGVVARNITTTPIRFGDRQEGPEQLASSPKQACRGLAGNDVGKGGGPLLMRHREIL